MLKSKIDCEYIKHSCERICQGDILRDFSLSLKIETENKDEIKELEIIFPYIVVVSQDCDLENKDSTKKGEGEYKTQFLPNIMVLPAFPSEKVKEGKHFEDIYQITLAKIDNDIWKRIKRNHDERYHFLNAYQEFQITELVIDFKNYYTIPFENFIKDYKDTYIATINELFRERLNQRFSNFINRIPLPLIKTA